MVHMTASERVNADVAAEAAINRVLEAEQQARAAVARAHRDAAERVTQARLRARRIEERADARASKVRAACQQWSAQRVAQLQAQVEELRTCAPVDEARRARLEAAIERLAAELTGEGT
jgi:vacuolar-type H+-ATPase subunit H